MRPVRLVVEGFTSFRKAQEIDFSELDLFVITGPTGSGKTSILDAVTLALYGMVPRTGKRDLKELISLGTSQAKVQLDFRVGNADYRVVRRIPRQRAQFATLERIEGETAIPEAERGGVTAVNERLVKIIGLDYRSFTTAVLLPQGDFASFLKGDVKVRRRILIRLLDLDRFERAGALARKKASELRTAVETGEDFLAREYGEDTSEALEEARTQAQDADEAAGTVEAAYREAAKNLSERERVGGRCNDIRELIAALEAQEEELEASASTLKEQSARDAETAAALQAADHAQSEAQETRRHAREAWNETVVETGDEGALATFKVHAKVLREADTEIAHRSAELDKNAEVLGEAESRAKELQAREESETAAEAEAAEAHEAAIEVRRSADEELRNSERADDLGRRRETRTAELAALHEQLADAEVRREDAVKDRDQKVAELEATQTQHRAAAVRAHLSRGDECPVCGASIEELPATDAEIESVLAAHQSAVDEARGVVVQAESELSALQARLEEGRGGVIDLDRQLEELGAPPALDDARSARATAVKSENEAKERLQTAKTRATSIQAKVAESKVKLAELEATRREAEKARDSAWERVESAHERLSEGLGDPLPEPVEDEIDARRVRLQEATEARNVAEARCEEAEKVYRAAAEARQVVTRELAELERQHGHQRTLLGERREQLGRLDVEVPTALTLTDAEGLEAETTTLKVYAHALGGAASGKAAELETELLALDASIRAHASTAGVDAGSLDAVTTTSALEKAARDARRTADRFANDVAVLEQRLERMANLQAEIDEKRGRMHQYNKVANELKTDRFIGFLLDESIEDLALRASHELKKISAGQYSLTSSKNNFTVVDHANADERRSVVTLSGGETFLASLALALALAQGITDIAGHAAAARLDAMFIDEGFGTLDPESLDQAIEALERLRDGERMVGIITHVPTLAERIPDGLSVEQKVGGTVVGVR